MDENGRLELLEEILKQSKIALPWMVDSLKHSVDELSGGNYSPELKHAIALREAVESL